MASETTQTQNQAQNSKGAIIINDVLIGEVEGLRFKKSQTKCDEKTLQSARTSANKEIAHRLDRLANTPNDEIILASDGFLRWHGEIIAKITKGEELYKPNFLLLNDDALDEDAIKKVNERISLWLTHHINTNLAQLLALKSPLELNKEETQALELCEKLFANFGVLARKDIMPLVKSLNQDVRGKLRRLGIKFGAFHIYLPHSLKPAPRELTLILWALNNGGIEQKGISDLPIIILSGRTSFEIDKQINPALYMIAGFKIAGNRVVRMDILERLADIIRPLIVLNPLTIEGELPEGAAEKNGFRVTVQMTSLLGCAGEDFSSVLKSLGYHVKRTLIEPEQKQENATDKEETKEEQEEPVTKYDEIWYPASFGFEQKQRQNFPNKNKNTKKSNNSKQSSNWSNKNKRPNKEKPLDPDSPFAALLALKNKVK